LSERKNFTLSPKTPPLPVNVTPLFSSKKNSYKLKQNIVPFEHIDIASTCNNLGLVLLKKDNFAKAAEQFQKS
jgi:hypothetical protein